ncbi:MmgE/PrpD family protein [Paraburkholderia sp.]|uniref:MmgE/PrpD family protein n=1 Tax=Paraburkholderia sp. TaxID=1926495 RepID=UPI0039E413AC
MVASGKRSQAATQLVTGATDSIRANGMATHIAGYVVAARGQRASEPARQAAFRCILDLLSAAVAGLHEPGVVAVRGMALETFGVGRSSIWFSGLSGSAIGAAWANSAAASALDLDDGHRLARGHPGAAVIPTAFAVAEETGATLEEIVSAIVIGYEVGVTIGAARLTYGNTGTWSAYAVVATAAALRQTSRDVLEHALAIAGESAPNQSFASAPAPRTPDPEGSDVKEGIPWSVVTGLMALGIAQAGHTGPRNILDSARHYRFPDKLRLGEAAHIRNVYFKLHACCRHVHAPLDALLALVQQHGIDMRCVDSIEVAIHGGALRILNTSHPANLVEVQYSIPYCLALVGIVGPSALLPLTREQLFRDDVSALAEKVTLRLDSELDACFPAQTLARVTVTSAGQHFTSDVTAPGGEATNPLTWAQLEAKFRAATRLIATGGQQSQVLDAVDALASGDLSTLMACLGTLVLDDRSSNAPAVSAR